MPEQAHTPGRTLPERLVVDAGRLLEGTGRGFKVHGTYNDPDFAAEIARRYNAHTALLAACEDFCACPGLSSKDFEANPHIHRAWTFAREAIREARGES